MSDPLVAWQAQLRGLTIGAGTPYDLTGPVTGLGALEPRTTDRDLVGDHGATAGLDTLPPRSLYFPLAMHGDGPAAAMGLLRDLKAAFGPAGTALEEVLELLIPGLAAGDEALAYYGRPRGLVEDLNLLRAGEVAALARFDALDPLGYGAPVTGSTTGTSATVTNAGDFASRAAVLTITGDGGTPVITNTTDDGRVVAWAGPLADGAQRFVDLRARTVTGTLGVDHYAEVAAGSTWFRFLPGPNTLAVAGVDTLAWSLRPAYT